MPSPKVHANHLWYVLRRKALFVRYGRMVGVSWWSCIAHDLLQFSPDLWRLAVRVYHQPEGEEWVKVRAAEIHKSYVHGLGRPSEDEILDEAKEQHVLWMKEQEKLSDRFALLYQKRAPWRWESWILRDLAQTRYVEMPAHHVRTMVADWLTGAMMSGAPEDELVKRVRTYYAMHRQEIRISPSNRKLVEELLLALKAK